MSSSNILILSISAKVPLIESLKQAKEKFNNNMMVYGADCTYDVIGKYFVDKFYLMDKLDILNINDFIIDLTLMDIKYIIPTRDEDVIFLSDNYDTFVKYGINLFLSNKDSVKLCSDKLYFFHQTKKFNSIKTYNDIDNIKEKNIVIKERFGSGSKNIYLNIPKSFAKKTLSKLNNPIYQPYIKGKEFSVDSYVNKHGKCIGTLVRSRDLISNGKAVITTYQNNKLLENITKKFVEQYKIEGHSVTQFIQSDDTYFLVECNARFGGASTLSIQMGLDSFYWFFCECNNIAINFQLNVKQTKQVRYARNLYLK